MRTASKNKILITGGTGFIGSHLVNFLKKKNIILLYSIQKKSKNLKKLKVSNTLNLISLLKESTKKLINNIFLM